MSQAEILAWTLPAAFVGISLIFFLVHLQVRGAFWWGIAYIVAAAGFAVLITDLPSVDDAKSVTEDVLLLSALVAMARGISQRFDRPSHDGLLLALVAVTGVGLAVALFKYHSDPAQYVIGQLCAGIILLFCAWQMRGGLRKTINKALFVVILLLAMSMILQQGYYLMSPFDTLLDPNWRKTQWMFFFQFGSGLFGLAFAFLALIAICLDAIESFRTSARTDPLSGLLNRRGFEERIDQLPALSATVASVAIVDIDHFKKINDTFGHNAGDMVIVALGTLLSELVGQGGSVARIGGEEFALHFKDLDAQSAAEAAQTIRRAFAAIEWPRPLTAQRLTVSAGVAEIASGGTLADALGRADACLYQAKRGGRDRVVAERRADRENSERSSLRSDGASASGDHSATDGRPSLFNPFPILGRLLGKSLSVTPRRRSGDLTSGQAL
ncbi:GGDEF domain-containing protein [Consotaella salsifontis]|uniref:diguanylate cyclase n=1 Tax=Consotaella salsifontis TaxID=1365950 RepID=A0A1T4RXX2_9HYPH|nr:GGDEF domain-containing protein [Consotaella salsifontis]SKA20813.1 diguanylate cyclase (GGDEF) domain-containing protein [Consotaella salsifontis]